MRQAELLRFVADWCSSRTGKTYKVDYAPMMNVSEQEVRQYRAVSPGAMRKETPNRGALPVTYQEVKIQIFDTFPSSDTDSIVPAIQDELEDILEAMMSRANPVRFTSEDGKVDGTVKAGECAPFQDSGVILSELEAHHPVCLGCVNVMFMVG